MTNLDKDIAACSSREATQPHHWRVADEPFVAAQVSYFLIFPSATATSEEEAQPSLTTTCNPCMPPAAWPPFPQGLIKERSKGNLVSDLCVAGAQRIKFEQTLLSCAAATSSTSTTVVILAILSSDYVIFSRSSLPRQQQAM